MTAKAHIEFVLSCPSTNRDIRLPVPASAPLGRRKDKIAEFLSAAIHLVPDAPVLEALATGPTHPGHGNAAAQIGVRSLAPCDPRITEEAIGYLVASEVIPPGMYDDPILRTAFEGSFATESDWDERFNTSSYIAEALTEGAEDECDGCGQAHTHGEVNAARITLASAIAVAATAARARWSA